MQSFTLILVSEIGDKTFLIAAIMATRHSQLTVFAGAFSSLLLMSVLSAALGKVILGLIPARYTQFVAAGLFLVFGIRMVQEGLKIKPGSGHIQEEIKEVEEELEEEQVGGTRDIIEMEQGRPASRSQHHHPLSAPSRTSSPFPSSSSSALSPHDLKNRTRNFCSLFFSPVYAQAFILTFLGEWGDRSQIATIALGGANVSLPPFQHAVHSNEITS